MSRYIDEEKVYEKIDQEMELCNSGSIRSELHYLKARISCIPIADVVEVVHAYWKETTHITESKRGREIHSKLYNCSNCDAPNGRKKSSYCHWCGAKMDGERREE